MRKQRGNVAMMAVFSTALMGMAALAVDVGMNTQTRTRIQSVADAAALAGGKSLMVDQAKAREVAVDFAQRNGVPITAADVSFPDSASIRVNWTQPLNGAFANAFGIQRFQVPVKATAGLYSMTGGKAIRPWGIPYQDFVNYAEGREYILKMATATDGYKGGGNFYPVALDGPGGDVYRNTVEHGSQIYHQVGDVVASETGNLMGPTEGGLAALIAGDAHDSAAEALADGHDCPRIVTVVLIEPGSLKKGKSTIQIAGFASFFVTDYEGQNGVKGRFTRYVHQAGTHDGGTSGVGTQTCVLID